MATIPTYEQWINDTSSLTSPRGDYLKQVDATLKTYQQSRTPSAQAALKKAFDRWRFHQSSQGKDWKKSVRNGKGAVTNLHRALTDVDRRNLSDEEIEALRYITRAQSMALQKQFVGAKLRFKSTTLVGIASGAGTKWQKFKTGASSAVSGAKTGKDAHGEVSDLLKIKGGMTELVSELCPGLDPDAVLKALNLGSVASFAADVAPLVGVVSSGGKAIVAWIGVARAAWKGIKVADARTAIAAGDPEAAFDALLLLIDREIASKTASASVKTAAFTGKTLGTFADAGAVTGPVIGLLEILAELMQTIVEYARDYKECEDANEALRLGALNLDLFRVSPLLGCYFLVVQDHSTIINFAVADYGTAHWMFDVERLVRRIEPVLSRGRYYIEESRLEIPELARAKGVVNASYSVATGLDKVTGAPAALKDRITDKIDSWFSKPEKPPPVPRARIVGFGNTD